MPPFQPGAGLRAVWGEVALLPGDETLHFAVCGCTGSGKTLQLRQLMQSVLGTIAHDRNHRALIYDANRDLTPFLHALGLGNSVFNLNPFDRRSVVWDLARDLASTADIEQFAAIIIPPNPNEHNPYFTDAARILLRCAIVALNRQLPRSWSLRDLVLCLSENGRLRSLLSAQPETKDVANNFFEAREFPSVMTTLETKIRGLRTVAALWDGPRRRISLRENWIQNGSILLLAHHPSYSEALNPMNRAIFRYLSDSLLAQADNPSVRSWIFLDEAREAGRLDGLRSLTTQGRKKGVCVVLGFQDIQGLREVYGKDGANELLGECNHKTLLRTDSPDTAAWMESHINRALLRAHQVGTEGRNGKKTSTESLRIDSTVLAADFLGIPITSMENGVKGLHISSRIPKPYWTTTPLKTILGRMPRIDPNIPGEDSRPLSDQELRIWTDADNQRLHLQPESSPVAAQSMNEMVQPELSTRHGPTSRPSPQIAEAPGQPPSELSASQLLWRVGRNGRGPA